MKLIDFLRNLPAFGHLSETELESFLACTRLFEFPEDYRFSSLDHAGDSAYLLVRGRVRLFQHDTALNRTLATSEICVGEIFNILSLVEDLTVPTTAIALDPCLALEIPRSCLTTFKLNSPRVAHQLQYMIAIQLANALHARNAALRAQLS